MRAGPGPRIFFVHVHKTAGSPLTEHLLAQFDQSVRYPRLDEDATWDDSFMQYANVRPLLEADPADVEDLRLIRGHLPFALVDALPEGTETITVLREPVDRTVSWLHHCQRYFSEHAGRSLEEIYEDAWYAPRFVQNHQCKVFGMTLAEVLSAPPEPPLTPELLEERPAQSLLSYAGWPIGPHVIDDQDLLERAKEALGRVNVLGLTEDLDPFLDRLSRRHGWTLRAVVDRNVSDRSAVSPELLRRIEADTLLDAELYDFARDLIAKT